MTSGPVGHPSPDAPLGVTLHDRASVTSTDPLTITTPSTPWSYAASFVLDGLPAGERVAEAVIQVRDGSVGVSFVDQAGQNLRHETIATSVEGPVVVRQVVEAAERGRLMIRTAGNAAAARVEVLRLTIRSITPEEVIAADGVTRLEPVCGWNAFFGHHAATVPQQLRSLRYRRVQESLQFDWLEGLRVEAVAAEQISRAVYVSGLYEPNTALVLKSWLHRGSVMVDIGANMGLFTLLASRWVGPSGKVLAVEPSPRERQRLLAHLRLNAITNVDVAASAVSDRIGSGELLIADREHSGLNTLASRFAYGNVTSVSTVPVPVVTLDSLIDRGGISRVDVIKLDVEGAEYAALKGGASTLSRHRPRLVIEVVPSALAAAQTSVAELASLLSDADYDLFDISSDAQLRPLESMDERHEDNLVAIPREFVRNA
jgi:FkbM family methyltransferase